MKPRNQYALLVLELYSSQSLLSLLSFLNMLPIPLISCKSIVVGPFLISVSMSNTSIAGLRSTATVVASFETAVDLLGPGSSCAEAAELSEYGLYLL